MNKRISQWFLRILFLTALLIIAAAFSMCMGSADITLNRIIPLLLEGPGSVGYSILMDIRLPRILLSIAVGGGLSLAGVLLQAMFRNPLVEPYTLGISGGAALAVCITIVLGLGKMAGHFSLPMSGFTGAVAVILLIYTFSVVRKEIKIQSLLLTGVMISFITSSVIMLLMSIASSEDLQGIVFWMMGSLEEPQWKMIYLSLAVSIFGLIVSYVFSLRLNALSLGEDEAHHLGMDTQTTKRYLFLIASMLTGCAVAVSGIIGFVGLVVPHFARMFLGRDHRILLIGAFLCGAIFLMLCDTAARTIISPLELPVGVITGILGGILFVYALTKRKVSL